MSKDSRAESSAFFEDELDAFKFRNEMRKRPDFVVKYPDIVGLTSDQFYHRIRQDNDVLANDPAPALNAENDAISKEIAQSTSRMSKLKGMFSPNDAS